MKSYKPKYQSEYSNQLQRKLLYREPAFLLNVKFTNVPKKSPKKSPQKTIVKAGNVEIPVKSNPTIFKIIADKIQPNSAVSIINRFISTKNTTLAKLKTFIKNIKELQYVRHNNLNKHLRVLLTEYKTVINVDGDKETNEIISEILPNANVKNINMDNFVKNIPSAELYVFYKCINKYKNSITDKLANLKGSIFVCDYDIETDEQHYYINFADKLTSDDSYFYSKKISIINLFGRTPTGESRAIQESLYNEYAILFS